MSVLVFQLQIFLLLMKILMADSVDSDPYKRVSDLLDKYVVFDDSPKHNIHFVTSCDLFDFPYSDVLELYVCKLLFGSLVYEFTAYLPDITQDEYDYIIDWYQITYDITYDAGFIEPRDISRPL